MSHSVTTGLSTGEFHTLRVLRNGAMEDILSVIIVMIAGGVTTINAGAGIIVSGTGTARTIASTCLSTLTAGSGIQITGTGTSRTIAATGGSTGTILQLGGVTQNGATTLNVAANIGAFASNVLSITAQPLVTSSTDLAMQDVTLRNIQAQTAIMLLRDNAGATALEIQASLIGLYKSTNMHETVNFYKAISLTNTASSLTNQLYVGTGNKLI